MNVPRIDLKEIALKNIEAINAEALRQDLSVADKAGMFSAMEILCADLLAYIEGQSALDPGRARETVHKVQWHTLAMIGYDTNDGHGRDHHRGLAGIELKALRGMLRTNEAA